MPFSMRYSTASRGDDDRDAQRDADAAPADAMLAEARDGAQGIGHGMRLSKYAGACGVGFVPAAHTVTSPAMRAKPHCNTAAGPAMTDRRLLAGASGYSFKEWRGVFYPEKMDPDAMLPFYAERLPSVEINNTFYRMPRTSMLEHWVEITPPAFRFAIKASRRITHIGRLKAESVADSVEYLYRNLASLGDKRGPVLFQLPPNLKKDVPRLTAFLALLPADHRAAFEFRNETWFADDVYEALKGAGASLCFSEREDDAPPPLVETAPWGYVRLRLENYSDDDLAQWARRMRATGWREIYAYFMHEPTAPAYATTLMQAVESHVVRTSSERRARPSSRKPRPTRPRCSSCCRIRASTSTRTSRRPPRSGCASVTRSSRPAARGDGSEHWLNWVLRLASGEAIGYVQATVEPSGRAFVAYVLGKPMVGTGARAARRCAR